MIKIFLVGEKRVGKSTIIERYIYENKEIYKRTSGFKTKELLADDCLLGFYLEDQLFNNEDYTLVGVNKLFPEGRNNEGITKAFNTRGVEILNNVLHNDSDLVVLDELGFFEENADKFKEKIIEILDTEKKVLGVLKKKTNSFLENIKNRIDVITIEVSIENRDNIIDQINKIWRDE